MEVIKKENEKEKKVRGILLGGLIDLFEDHPSTNCAEEKSSYLFLENESIKMFSLDGEKKKKFFYIFFFLQIFFFLYRFKIY